MWGILFSLSVAEHFSRVLLSSWPSEVKLLLSGIQLLFLFSLLLLCSAAQRLSGSAARLPVEPGVFMGTGWGAEQAKKQDSNGKTEMHILTLRRGPRLEGVALVRNLPLLPSIFLPHVCINIYEVLLHLCLI